MKLIGYSSDDIDWFNRKARKSKHRKKPVQCIYCETPLGIGNFTKDHIVPKSKGGRRTKPCCYTCNQEKRNMTVKEYIAYLESLPPTGLILNKIRNANKYKAM